MEITASAVQLVAVNQNVLFTDTPIAGSKCIMHREGSGLVTLRGLTNQCNARFLVTFGGNIAVPDGGTAGPIALALTLNGEPLVSSRMIATPAAINEYFNVAGSTFVVVPKGCCFTVSVENASAIPINVQDANLIVTRVA